MSYNEEVEEYNEQVDKENEQYIMIDKGALFRLIRLLKEARNTYPTDTSKGIYERNRLGIIASFCDNLIDKENFDGLIISLEKKVKGHEMNKKMTEAIKEHGDIEVDDDGF